MSPDEMPLEPPRPQVRPVFERRRRRRLPVLLAAIAALAALFVAGGIWWQEARLWESTDDAFIDAHMVRVGPQVAGRVSRVLVRDNQLVRRGEPLLDIDPADFKAKLDQALAGEMSATAALAQARAQQVVSEAGAEQSMAQIEVAEANAQNGAIQLKRDQALVVSRAISAQQLDNSIATARSTEATLVAARKKHASDQAALSVAEASVEAARANLASMSAQVEQARLNLSYTKIIAPEDGHIARENVAVGDYVQVGQNLFALVPVQVWITANFKETQIELMRPGQPVEIRVDAYPGKIFKGHVDSFQPGSGAAFSLLPPENATGNYVKVVQRVPVKILFDDAPDPGLPLGPGMSVVPSVKVR